MRGAIAAGRRIGELPIGEHTWVALVVRGGAPSSRAGRCALEPGDEVVLLSDPADEQALRHVFTRAARTPIAGSLASTPQAERATSRTV